MKNDFFVLVVMLSLSLALHGLGQTSAYTLTVPAPMPLIEEEEDIPSDWSVSNAFVQIAVGGGALTVEADGTVKRDIPTSIALPNAAIFSLPDSIAGYAVERVKPQYGLGELIEAPLDVDWTATYNEYATNTVTQKSFLFDTEKNNLYAVNGGTHDFTWILNDSSRRQETYIISTVCNDRPYRIFWTDKPYYAPPVSLSGKFVKLFGASEILDTVQGTNTTLVGGVQLDTPTVVKGLFIDESGLMYAVGGIRGQIVLAYYDSGDMKRLLNLQVIEICEPEVIRMKGTIGKAIEPYGSGYNPNGLRPYPTIPKSEEDNRGPYFYQHVGNYSYSPKDGNVYPLRPTINQEWMLEVYWKETDPLGTIWPFELCHYSCDWGNDISLFVRGDKENNTGLPISIDETYTVTLMDYQEPEGHAMALSSGEKNFVTIGEGKSLLKLMTPDNVWFLPIQSIFRSNTNYFTLEQESWLVGDEIVMRGGNLSGTSASYKSTATGDVSGYIYPPVSGDHYNTDLYYKGNSTVDGGTNDANRLPSVIYPIATGAKPIEVWWSSIFLQEDMPAPVMIPSLVQQYTIRWPDENEAAKIVLASQQGSAASSCYNQGIALKFSTGNSIAELIERPYFLDDQGSISFWTIQEAPSAPSAILTMGAATNSSVLLTFDEQENGSIVAQISNRMSGVSCALSTPVLPSNTWQHIAFSISETNVVLFLNGVVVKTKSIPYSIKDLSDTFAGNSIGISPRRGLPASAGRSVDDIAFWSKPMTAENIVAMMYQPLQGREEYLTGYYEFSYGKDLNPIAGKDYRFATEKVLNRTIRCYQVVACQPGAPRRTSGIIESDTMPTIYYQNDPSKPGYNPNDEHAFIREGNGGYIAWAIRTDLNESPFTPSVLVTYQKDGKNKMRYFSVKTVSDEWPGLAGIATAGRILPGPHPLDLLDNPWMDNTYWKGDVTNTPAFRDRKKQVWARCAGQLPIYMYYPMQDGFYFPSLSADTQPPVGTAIPWLARLNNLDADVLKDNPTDWLWSVNWPENCPEMRIGQTLTKASGGLPEVWGAKSVALIYPDPSNADNQKNTKLFDPTVIRTTGDVTLSGTAEMLTKYSINVSDNGNAMMRKGKYFFRELPPTLSSRFYLDPSLNVGQCLCLAGELNEPAGYTPMLYVNVLNADERKAIVNLVPDSHAAYADWKTMIDHLATEPVIPNSATSHVGKEGKESANQLAITYSPVDHYALAALGATGYVCFIENDYTNKAVVADGDSISMKIIQIIPEYYTANVVTREDDNNLLSQQLDVLYTESFAGTADDFIFEWTSSLPPKPESFDAYSLYRDSDSEWSRGRTRFTIGSQGDTLENMVNTYFAVRYKAKEGTLAAQIMGNRWSDWCGPALAEGWIQRVMNNITPFNQKMKDLYENPAETVVSMIQQAGKPYEGDVALNQDNLVETGLIELYETLLNKAESMSILQGVNYGEANKQLLLAAERLADLYQILGDEAYTDAMNPTIGFGSEFSTVSDSSLGIDYGALSSGLFCFDNQVSSLLDEELALLRGRTERSISPSYNRLLWNFTRGITAGEVAYAVNYNITGDRSAELDVSEAAALYPQGHGDAWGHYLSGLSTYYRLLRNPYFSWGKPVAGEMNVGDANISVDYKDEQRFADIAASLAKTAESTLDRTARKTWADNAGVSGGGYLDKQEERNFGYGEWATRGGFGALCNWVVANSLLPEVEDARYYHQLKFEKVEDTYGDGATEASIRLPDSIRADLDSQGWTLEFQVDPNAVQQPDTILLNWSAQNGDLYVKLNEDLRLCVTLETNLVQSIDSTFTTQAWEIALCTLQVNKRVLIALSRLDQGVLTARVINTEGIEQASEALPDSTLPLVGGGLILGTKFSGFIHEIRFWNAYRETSELYNKRNAVNPAVEGLLMSFRTITRDKTEKMISDQVLTEKWSIRNPVWQDIMQSGLEIAFDDGGLNLITRENVPALNELSRVISSLQEKTDRLDAGMNPIGLSASSIPFDITPLGVNDGTYSHFEQVESRAEQALKNASAVLNRAQTLGCRLRQVEESASAYTQQLAMQEDDYTSQLIEIYGYPYADDIGPAGTYVQGYNGPDLYHFFWTDLSSYGLSSLDITPMTNISYILSGIGDYSTVNTTAMNMTLSANGLIIKPSTITGTRRAVGKIQQAYSDFILAYIDVQNAADWYQRCNGALVAAAEKADVLYGTKMAALVYQEAYDVEKMAKAGAKFGLALKKSILEATEKKTDKLADSEKEVVPGIFGAGMTVVSDAPRSVNALIVNSTLTVGLFAIQIAKDSVNMITEGFNLADTLAGIVLDMYNNAVAMKAAEYESISTVASAINTQWNAGTDLETKYAKMVAASEAFNAIIAQGERLQEERELVRQQAVNGLTRLRYNDMFFRKARNASLQRYESAFNLAQKYVYLAAKVYDYETLTLPTDNNSADAFFREIIAARSLGEFTANGSPMLGSGYTDPGLSDILARMKENWLVLKPRLGINNPQTEATWFSLRKECFGISQDAAGDKAWRTELSKYWVNDLKSHSEFKRFCQPFYAQVGTKIDEPGLVIPFSTTIDFAKNFFGNDLSGEDSAFDSTYYATKIAGAGIHLVNYNTKLNGYSGSSQLGNTPSVYLIPVGGDRMRVPGSTAGEIREYTVVDQVVPVPYAIGSTQLDSADWQPTYDGYTGGVDLLARIRRYPSFRAGIGTLDNNNITLANTRLIGRSVWNTRWLLIIPAGTLNGAMDRDSALKLFINGKDTNGDGMIDLSGVTDIRLGLKSYSMSGN